MAHHSSHHGGHAGDVEAIKAVLQQYEAALNASNTAQALQLYTADGVFMPQHSASAVGTEQVKAAYDAVFGAIQLAVKFTVAEVQVVAADWAFARTTSAGSVKVKASGGGGPEANQELFVFQKVGGQWKIARYCFCTTNPPHA